MGEEWSRGPERNLSRRRISCGARGGPGTGDGRGAAVAGGGGYRPELGAGSWTRRRSADLGGRGREAARAGDAAAAREPFGQALGLGGGRRWPTRRRCARGWPGRRPGWRRRGWPFEERIGCDLALGRHGEVAGELAGLVAEFPLRERLAGLLMTALYRCGRRGEALAVYDGTRRVLAGELGLDPGPELAGLQAQVLADDPALAAPARAAGGAARTGLRRRRGWCRGSCRPGRGSSPAGRPS